MAIANSHQNQHFHYLRDDLRPFTDGSEQEGEENKA